MKIKNLCRYYTFGLRNEWMEKYFSEGEKIFEDYYLGEIQKIALKNYFIDMGFYNNDSNILFSLKSLFFMGSTARKFFWAIIWSNLYFNSSIFNWWGNIEIGSYSKEDIIKKIIESYKKNNRSVINAYGSLRDTFNKSPIGNVLGQGIVDNKNKTIEKIGFLDIDVFSVLYSLYKYAHFFDVFDIPIFGIENSLFSPQRVFAVNSKKIFSLLLGFFDNSFFYIKGNDRETVICLKPNILPIDILDFYINSIK